MAVFCGIVCAADAPDPHAAKRVDDAAMQRVYDEVKTPFKYGIVLHEQGGKVDCPSVYRAGETWYMMYIVFDGSGYETWLAESADLLTWKKLGRILSFGANTWDAQQKAGYVALQDTTWGGTHALGRHDGRYWLSYIGGALKGYETDPLAIGLAWSADHTKAAEWNRLNAPVLSPADPDSRHWEKLTLYKSNILHDSRRTLGHPFVMFYNAKTTSGYERIGIAVSDDMQDWKRFGVEPVIDNGSGISGDPQVVRMGDLWVMFYFGAFYRPGAFDTFACSHDLVHWRTWDGPDLVAPSEPWDKTYAHKPWLVKHDGVVYHFYCAVGDQGRVIALATSKDLKK
ncbi:MAG: glycosylase [Phycisphaerae bacterium]|nr:glycosylase [Phycisphaerae bacterium]